MSFLCCFFSKDFLCRCTFSCNFSKIYFRELARFRFFANIYFCKLAFCEQNLDAMYNLLLPCMLKIYLQMIFQIALIVSNLMKLPLLKFKNSTLHICNIGQKLVIVLSVHTVGCYLLAIVQVKTL